MTKAALLLVDLQNDFLDAVGLVPGRADVVAGAAEWLRRCRIAGWPVFHIHTRVRVDGGNRMPHRAAEDAWRCVEGTAGARTPSELEPEPDERVFSKRFYSGFEDPAVDAALKAAGIELVVVSGVYTHACVRTTALDAYAHGYQVRIARDAVASVESLHAALSMDYLQRRSMTSMDVGEMFPAQTTHQRSVTQRLWALRNPARCDEVLAEVALAGAEDVARSGVHALHLQEAWTKLPRRERVAVLEAWGAAIAVNRKSFVAAIVRDIGKPVSYAEAEFNYALDLLRQTASTLEEESSADKAAGFFVRHAPVGNVGIITPWNNPLAIPLGKLAPALAWGNGVVWKPALPATRIARRVMDTLREVWPTIPVALVEGDAVSGALLLRRPEIDAITFTGSTAQGEIVAAICAERRTPVQAELGGNNAVLVMADADVDHVATILAPALFGFGGQRCTAPRRVIVDRSRRAELERALLQRASQLVVGEPDDPAVQVGPLVSTARQARMKHIVDTASGRILCGGRIPPGFEHGAWFEPTLIGAPDEHAPVVMEESFGPVAVLMSADDPDHALALNNAVPHGLVTTVFTNERETLRKLLHGVRSGIVAANLSPVPISVAAPFGGWKASGIGPPEHGRWDREFYAKPQACYGFTAGHGDAGEFFLG